MALVLAAKHTLMVVEAVGEMPEDDFFFKKENYGTTKNSLASMPKEATLPHTWFVKAYSQPFATPKVHQTIFSELAVHTLLS